MHWSTCLWRGKMYLMHLRMHKRMEEKNGEPSLYDHYVMNRGGNGTMISLINKPMSFFYSNWFRDTIFANVLGLSAPCMHSLCLSYMYKVLKLIGANSWWMNYLNIVPIHQPHVSFSKWKWKPMLGLRTLPNARHDHYFLIV